MDELDPVIHGQKRLRIMTILCAADVEFSYLQSRLEVTSPDLSKQMRHLTDACYVRSVKTGKGPGSTTWYRLTRSGRTAYRAYIEGLAELLDLEVSP